MASLTATVTEVVTQTVNATAAMASATSTNRATPQGGILEGANPTHYDSKNPVILFIIQAGIIIIFCRLLHWPLGMIRQPRVIAEVIGGILLGPSVMGRIPGFTDAIFPAASIPNLNNVANLGLILFLFMVGLEVDLRYFVANWRIALSVGAAGMALPFGLGCAIAWGLYNEFSDEPNTVPIAFGTYMLFIGIAIAITAFPVLCRILTELKLLSTKVGLITLAAGVSNDVVGWILLALCVALVNAGSGLTALWVVLVTVGYAAFLFMAVKPVFHWYLRRNRALSDGPSQSVIVVTLLIALGSSFFTGVIGVHAIFGAFMAGLICPHEGGFAIKLTEKIEDLISALFLPLYFALSGLSTNIGLLDNGITWAYVIGVIAVAFVAKFVGGTLGARVNGLVWRESFTIGALMSCKGLVELIVLNIGLQARILSIRTFTIFVVMALVTTFATTPLVQVLYPEWYQRKLEAWRRGEIDWDTGKPLQDAGHDYDSIGEQKAEFHHVRNLMVYLRLDNMPTLLAFISLLGNKSTELTPKLHPSKAQSQEEITTTDKVKSVTVHGVRLVELTERGSAVMQVSEIDEYSAFDPILNAFRVLGQLFNLAVSGEVAVIPEASFADTLLNKAVEEASDLLLIPWSETGTLSEKQTVSNDNVKNKLTSDQYSAFVSEALRSTQSNTAVFINKGFSGTLKTRSNTLERTLSHLSVRSGREQTLLSVDRSHHIFMPFFGVSGDDRIALRIVLQLAENPTVTATVVHYETPDDTQPSVTTEAKQPQSQAVSGRSSDYATLFASIQRSIPANIAPRVVFESVHSTSPLEDALSKAQGEVSQNPKNGGDIVVVGRHIDHFRRTGSAPDCLGAAADTFAASGIRASLLVVQAKGTGLE
ncbi:K(+)/H(+) antiporter 1 [Fulvia fulva]|uniref:K(+)/H(+) antiporter 1 n=1 Tax=Passalora fulva TaxID=5499 RepID=A0A9Q8L4R9_PASFU|nr:K(+)/H(+) antiporter 1 [Fulvia fulva]KAK4634457.1 K(+)/H(+) antiporter 1 [Fulvia fulva]KAK4638254.1 K(+)/H(+) antiporter 1 [Fulvia fulva]UJO10796.1 K(+)/H(+) antiporter 1 [Fulvia fulva]WPV09466.1 K(+)/H(+) antiporter 1 [Fulvia fulva]WPV23043.1 K(+)/H(+) antiporter 1 [Fulvia fulva]